MKREDFENIEDYIKALENECSRAKAESKVRQVVKGCVEIGKKLAKIEGFNVFDSYTLTKRLPLKPHMLSRYPVTFLEILKGNLEFRICDITKETETKVKIKFRFLDNSKLTQTEYVSLIDSTIFRYIDFSKIYLWDYNKEVKKFLDESEQSAKINDVPSFCISCFTSEEMESLFKRCEDILKRKD